MEDKDDRQHFSLKGIMDSEKKKSKKKRKRKEKEEEMVDDNFNVDLKDSRFDALFTSHHFAVDPSDPQYRLDQCTNSLYYSSVNRGSLVRRILHQSTQPVIKLRLRLLFRCYLQVSPIMINPNIHFLTCLVSDAVTFVLLTEIR